MPECGLHLLWCKERETVRVCGLWPAVGEFLELNFASCGFVALSGTGKPTFREPLVVFCGVGQPVRSARGSVWTPAVSAAPGTRQQCRTCLPCTFRQHGATLQLPGQPCSQGVTISTCALPLQQQRSEVLSDNSLQFCAGPTCIMLALVPCMSAERMPVCMQVLDGTTRHWTAAQTCTAERQGAEPQDVRSGKSGQISTREIQRVRAQRRHGWRR